MAKSRSRAQVGPAPERAANISGSSDAVDHVIQSIESLIAVGDLVPGQRLVEADLIATLQVGRGPIREALRILAGDGVVELTPNRGARLRKYQAKEILDQMQVMLHLHQLAVKLFLTGSHPKAVYDRLMASAARIVKLGGEGNALELVREFFVYHRIFNENSGNEQIQKIIDRMHISLYTWEMLKFCDVQSLFDIACHYTRMTKHVRDRNGELALEMLYELGSEIERRTVARMRLPDRHSPAAAPTDVIAGNAGRLP